MSRIVTLVGRLAPRSEPELAAMLRQVFRDVSGAPQYVYVAAAAGRASAINALGGSREGRLHGAAEGHLHAPWLTAAPAGE